MTTRLSPMAWEPANETLDAIANVIASHWNAAKAYRERWFAPDAGSWLRALSTADSLSATDSEAYHFANGGKLIR
jgi:hypothetical protein